MGVVQIPKIVLIVLIWVIVGLVVALNKGYGDINSGSDAWSFGLAVVLWPLPLAGAAVSIRF